MSLFSLIKSGYRAQKKYYFKIDDDDNNSPQIIHRRKKHSYIVGMEVRFRE